MQALFLTLKEPQLKLAKDEMEKMRMKEEETLESLEVHTEPRCYFLKSIPAVHPYVNPYAGGARQES